MGDLNSHSQYSLNESECWQKSSIFISGVSCIDILSKQKFNDAPWPQLEAHFRRGAARDDIYSLRCLPAVSAVSRCLGRGVRVGAVSAAAARLARVVRGGPPEHAAQQPRAVGQRGHRRPQRGHRVSPANIVGVTFYLYRAMGFYSQRSHLLLLRLPRPSDCLNWSSLLIV